MKGDSSACPPFFAFTAFSCASSPHFLCVAFLPPPASQYNPRLIFHDKCLLYDALNDYVDDHTAARICRWVKGFLVFGAATVRRLKLEHPSIVTNYGINSTSETLRYFVRVVVNVGEWKQYEFM